MSHFYRIHHIRPRFKNDVESVLAFMANAIVDIGESDKEEFKYNLNNAIKFYPGNSSLKIKTINNWRTEISALFGLIVEDNGKIRPSDLSIQLNKSGDLLEFFRSFLYNFQYPGGHLKPKEVDSMISAGIKFKPAHYLLELLVYGTTQSRNSFGVSKVEATHFIFNNLKVTRDGLSVDKIYDQIIQNRDRGNEYKSDSQLFLKHYPNTSQGDMVRYAGDILDYLELAGLLDRKLDNKYYPRMYHKDIIDQFIEDNDHFSCYDDLYELRDSNLEKVKEFQTDWQIHASRLQSFGSSINVHPKSTTSTSGTELVSEPRGNPKILTAITHDIKKRLDQLNKNNERTTLDIGNLGEAIVIEHEKNRIKNCGGSDQIHKIVKLPENFSMGFDIKSILGLEGDVATQIFIEVKTTMSRNKLSAYTFLLTGNEFNAAKSHKKLYFIYRVFITDNDLSLFVIRDPIMKAFQEGKEGIDMNLTNNGAQFKFDETAGKWEEILIRQ